MLVDRRVPATTVLVVMAVSGFAALALEIVWFRVLVQFLPATTVRLHDDAGHGARRDRRRQRAGGAPPPASRRDGATSLAWVQGATSVVVLLSLAVLGATYAAGWRTSGLTQAAAAAILPASLLMGYAFPVAIALWTRARPDRRRARSARRRAVLGQRPRWHRRRRRRRLRAAAAPRQPPGPHRARRALPRHQRRDVPAAPPVRAGADAGRPLRRRGPAGPGSVRGHARPPPRPRPAHLLARRGDSDVGEHPCRRLQRLADVPRWPAPGVGRAGHGQAASADRPPADGAAPESPSGRSSSVSAAAPPRGR